MTVSESHFCYCGCGYYEENILVRQRLVSEDFHKAIAEAWLTLMTEFPEHGFSRSKSNKEISFKRRMATYGSRATNKLLEIEWMSDELWQILHRRTD